jgi:hypothetical protein
MPAPRAGRNAIFDAMRSARAIFEQDEVAELFGQVSERRVRLLAADLEAYIGTNLPAAISRRSQLTDYRTNPYVLMTCGSAMNLDDPMDFATFLVNNKLYMGLETSFGKSIESIVLGVYPVGAAAGEAWAEAPEKLAEFATYDGMSREERARARAGSVWREIDRACVVDDVRYLTTIKSGPNTINDTQVNAMKDAIRDHSAAWLEDSRANYGVESIAVVLGLTYGTPRTTNNKDNQLIVKLLESGFVEEDRVAKPGVLIDQATGRIRVYRVVGSYFWSFVASPVDPSAAEFAFLEVLLGLAIALREVSSRREVEESLNERLQMLGAAIATLRFPRNSLPSWVRSDLAESELFWLASAMTGFFDEGI